MNFIIMICHSIFVISIKFDYTFYIGHTCLRVITFFLTSLLYRIAQHARSNPFQNLLIMTCHKIIFILWNFYTSQRISLDCHFTVAIIWIKSEHYINKISLHLIWYQIYIITQICVSGYDNYLAIAILNRYINENQPFFVLIWSKKTDIYRQDKTLVARCLYL